MIQQLSDETICLTLANNCWLISVNSSDYLVCQIFDHYFKYLSEHFSDICYGQADIKNVPKLIDDFNITTVPTVLFFKHGKLLVRWRGVPNLNILCNFLKNQYENQMVS